jgi:V/A-type H+-transporting ATPase subunit D
MSEETKTTRLELIETKNRIRLAEKGHDLLKQKRDVLVMEFFRILKKARDRRSELNRQMETAFKSLAVAEAYHGLFEIESIALAVKKAPGVTVEARNVMGVKIPRISGEGVKKNLLERGYSFIGSSAKIDECAEAFENALEMAIELAETENALKRLVAEIEKTKRRVNALEYVLLPRLQEKKKYVSMRLDEIEREQFIALKTIKRKLTAKKEMKGS